MIFGSSNSPPAAWLQVVRLLEEKLQWAGGPQAGGYPKGPPTCDITIDFAESRENK